MTDKDLAISVEHLEYSYDTHNNQALNGLSLSIPHGQFVGIIGQNGAGKTTLLKNIVGLLRPSSGRIVVDGVDTCQLTVAEMATRVGFVLQNPDQQLFAETVEEEIAVGPRNLGLPANEVKTRVETAMGMTGLNSLSGEYPPALPKGERARVVIASVLAMQPEIIVLDEPTTGQDYKGCHQIMKIAQRLHHDGRTIVVVTHNMALVTEYAERVVVLGQGKVLLDGSTQQVFSQPEALLQTSVTPPQVCQLSQSLPIEMGLISCALTVEDFGLDIVEHVVRRNR